MFKYKKMDVISSVIILLLRETEVGRPKNTIETYEHVDCGSV